MPNVIEVKNLLKTYKKGRKGGDTFRAVDNVSFNVEKGEIFGLLGPNGAGKTTTLEIIEGLKKQDSGKVTILGLDNLRHTTEIKKRIGVQLQESGYLPNLTLGELLSLFASFYHHETTDIKWLLRLVDLESKEHAYVKDLSGGQRQRFTIATTMVNSPEIVFLDEPTTGLDPSARRSLWQLVKNINSQGITVILTTHYSFVVIKGSKQAEEFAQGKILEIDEPAKLIDNLSQTSQISFLTDATVDEAIFYQAPGVTKVFHHAPKTILEIDSLNHIGEIVELLRAHRIKFSGFMVKTASLEDVYLDLTGKEFDNE
ncbi:MAG: ABC transporter ATP-binding protein [Patescibacteria group bacterium]|nr:ABC transporter ATP-binding protein [Patescibacteria group bacterium]